MNTCASGKVLSILLLALLAVAPVALAQPNPERADVQARREATQPGNNAPFWTDVQGGRIGSTQIENIEAGSLINTAGETWRSLHEGPVRFWVAVLLIAVAAAILLFYFVIGPMRLHEAPTGRTIRRFAAWEMSIHWTAAITFIILAVTGLTLYFGKYYLAMLLTYPLYSWVARIFVSVHNFTAPVFAISLVLLFLAFVKRNAWRRYDWVWVRHGGGLISKRDPGSGFFNAGEKLWFWLVVTLFGLIMIGSGLVLLFPVYGQTRTVLSIADTVHVIGALVFIAAALGHVYMGTIGMVGAYRAMRRGAVDETWAREHHRLWYEDLRAGRAQEASDAPLVTTPAKPEAPRPAS